MPTYPGDPDVTLAPDATHEGTVTRRANSGPGLTPGPTWTRRGTRSRGGSRSTSERWASSRSTRASSIFGRWSRERQSRPKSFPNRTSSTPRSTSSSSEPAGRPTGDRSVPRPPVPDRGAARRCQKLGVGVGLDTFGPDPTPPGSAKTTGPSRETEPEGTPRSRRPFKRFAADRGEPVRARRAPRGIPAVRLPAPPPGADGSPVRAVAEWEGTQRWRAAARETDQTRFKRRRRIATQGRYPWKCHVVSTRTVPTVTPTRSTKWRRFDRVGRPE